MDKNFLKLMLELEKQLVTCMKCGMCQSVCPLFAQTRKEADVARGKLALLDFLMNDMLKDPHGVNKRLHKCLLCGSCAANCPSGVNAVEIFIKARIIITGYLKLSVIQKIVLRKMLAKPAAFDRIIRFGTVLQKFFLPNKNFDTKITSLKVLPLNDRRIIPLADISLQKILSILKKNGNKSNAKLINKPDKTGLKIAFFTGCLIDKIFPDIGIAAIKSLSHHNFQVFIPENQGCCGMPALAAGDMNSFLTLMKHNLKLFSKEKFDYLVTACATCTSTLKKLWLSMADNMDGILMEEVMDIAEKTFDISQFLVHVAGLKTLKNNEDQKIVTYHDPCHLAKSLAITKEPRKVILASGYTLKEMTDPDQCCGMGGSFNLYHYGISLEIAKIKKENIKATGCHTIATSCPACMMQISDVLSRGTGNIDIKHPIELYAKKIK